MAGAVGQFVIQGIVQGGNNPQLVLPPYYIPTTTSEPSITDWTLASGNNVIPVENYLVNQVLILIPPNYGWPTPGTSFPGQLIFKGPNSGDTGFQISNTWPTVLSITTGQGTFYINNNSATTGVLTVITA